MRPLAEIQTPSLTRPSGTELKLKNTPTQGRAYWPVGEARELLYSQRRKVSARPARATDYADDIAEVRKDLEDATIRYLLLELGPEAGCKFWAGRRGEGDGKLRWSMRQGQRRNVDPNVYIYSEDADGTRHLETVIEIRGARHAQRSRKRSEKVVATHQTRAMKDSARMAQMGSIHVGAND